MRDLVENEKNTICIVNNTITNNNIHKDIHVNSNIKMNYSHQVPQGARRAVLPRTATSLNTEYMETISVRRNYIRPIGQI